MINIVTNINLGVTPVCNFSCGNGNCVADNLCQCFDGWTGDRCDEGTNYYNNNNYYYHYDTA